MRAGREEPDAALSSSVTVVGSWMVRLFLLARTVRPPSMYFLAGKAYLEDEMWQLMLH